MTSISVVMPCYCAAATVERAVESVASQTLLPFELIVVDDASEDASMDVLNALARRFRPGWLRIERLARNHGASTARNHGWSLAVGTYIAFLDADDSWSPRKLELQLAFMTAHPEIALSGHAHVFGAIAFVAQEPDAWRLVTFKSVLWRNPFVTPSVMVRRLVSPRFRDGQRHMEDHLLWQQLAATGHRIARLDMPLVSLHKPQFGASGLSADLLKMEMAELSNYRLLRRDRHIGIAQLLLLNIWSALRFARRLVIASWRRLATGSREQ